MKFENSLLSVIRNDNPDKGTETQEYLLLKATNLLIRNDNPDKGTETNVWKD